MELRCRIPKGLHTDSLGTFWGYILIVANDCDTNVHMTDIHENHRKPDLSLTGICETHQILHIHLNSILSVIMFALLVP